MRKYSVVLGLLIAASLIFSACPTKFKPINEKQLSVVSVKKSVLEGGYSFESGIKVASTEEVIAYASMTYDNLFEDFNSLGTAANGKIASGNVLSRVGNHWVVGAHFFVGFRKVNKNDGKILKSLAYKVTVLNSSAFYVDITKAELVYALGDWWVRAEVKSSEATATLAADVWLGGNGKTEKVSEKPVKVEVVGSGSSAKYYFICKVNKELLEKEEFKNIPLHARFEVTDVEDPELKSVSAVAKNITKVDPKNTGNSWNLWVKTTTSVKQYLTTTEKPEDRLVANLKPTITFANLAKTFANAIFENAEKANDYRYMIAKTSDFASAEWKEVDGDFDADDDLTVNIANDLDYNQEYFLKVKLVVTETGNEGTHALVEHKYESPVVSFKTIDGYNTTGFVFDNSGAKKIVVDGAKKYFDGKYENTPAGLKAAGAAIELGELKLANTQKLDSFSYAAGYSAANLNFKLRLPDANKLVDLLTKPDGTKKFVLKDSEGEDAMGYAGGGGMMTVATFDANGVVATLTYKTPVLKANKKNSDFATEDENLEWSTSTKGQLLLTLSANGKTTEQVLFETGDVLFNSENKGSVATITAANFAKIKEVDYNKETWHKPFDVAISMGKKISVTMSGKEVSAELTSAYHHPILAVGYTNFTFTSGIPSDAIYLDDIKYMVTK